MHSNSSEEAVEEDEEGLVPKPKTELPTESCVSDLGAEPLLCGREIDSCIIFDVSANVNINVNYRAV